MTELTVRKIGLISHVIEALCMCDDIECCRAEVYVSDVRIAAKVAEDALARLARCTCGTRG